MGLDFRVYAALPCANRAHWSYSGFHEFRKRLAIAIGINLDKAYDSKFDWKTVDDSLRWLLNHSDCDGYLSAEQCSDIAPRLRAIIATWPENDYDAETGILLAEMMEKAAAHDGILEFC